MNILIIVLVNLVMYFKTLRFGYVSDDIPGLREQQTRSKKLRLYYDLLAVPCGDKQIDHLTSLIVHTLACVFIYLALGSLWAALLFSVNPINNQGAIWISGRHHAWCVLGLMMAIALPYIAFLPLLMATFCPVGYIAPVGFIGMNKFYLVFLLPLVWGARYFVSRYILKDKGWIIANIKNRRTNEAVEWDRQININKFIVAIKMYGYYFALCVVPFKITFYHSFMQSGAGAGNEIERKKAFSLNWPFWVGIGLLIYMVYSLFNWTSVSWGIFWYSVCIAPYTNLYRMQQEFAERYAYVANVGVMFALSQLVSFPVFMLFFGVYMARLYSYIHAYTDDYWIVEHSVIEDPGAWFAWHIRAHKRWNHQSYREALNCWVMAKMMSPKEFKLLFNIAVVLKILGNHAESEEYIKLAQENIIKGQEQKSMQLIQEFKEAKDGKLPLLR